ncbi:MAG: PEP-CTERM sorting domain-containing protein [Oxalobacteraceae bacterium]|nr:MAG: PEP-CTERM sorting domain-containing protein [Oxalobacteraceae bacterium]
MFTNGNFAIPSYTTATVFQNFSGLPDNTAYTPRSNETVGGDVRTMQGSIPGIGVQPTTNDDNTYLDIVRGAYTVSLSTPAQYFSFVLGSLDSYNQLTLVFANGSSTIFTGREIIGETSPGAFNSNTAGRVSFDVGGGAGISTAIFTSSQAAFEIDSLASAVPEPATWAMMMVGLGVIGGSLRRRPKVTTSFA